MKKKILIIEDEANIRELVMYNLKANGYDAIEAEDGISGITLAYKENPDLILLDIMLPGKDGYEICRELRSEGIEIPIIMLTAKSEVDDKVEGLDSGANDYLTKPFQSKELLARIRAMTRNGTAQLSSQLKMGNVTLNQATFELSTPSGSVRLANKEFQMLELMMSNPHRLISSEHFMEKIWGYDSDAEINVVWVYISYLRKKLSAISADIQIKATRNAGYSLEELT